MAMSMPAKTWTLEELHRLPEDGNRYEVVRGELFVTPPPSIDHEEILARLSTLLSAYVERHRLGRVYHPRSVVRFEGSEAEPDLMVRQIANDVHGNAWEALPAPDLVIEALSPATRRRDLVSKRGYYMDAGVREYWVIDGDRREVLVVRPNEPDRVVSGLLTWRPSSADPLVIDVASLTGA